MTTKSTRSESTSTSPPPLSKYLSSLLDHLETTNSRLSLSVATPPHGLFKPGDTLHPVVTLHKRSAEYTSLQLSLVVSTHALIYGKDRWQKGQMASAMLGNATTGAPITTIEQVPVYTVQVPWTSPNNVGAAAPPAAASEKEQKRSLASKAGSDGPLHGGVYEIILPHPRSGELLPTMRRKDEGLYSAFLGSFIFVERGMDSSNWMISKSTEPPTFATLQIELPVGFPIVPPIPEDLPESEWVTTTGSKDLLHKGTQGGGAITLHAKLSIHPPSRITTRIPFHLTCSPSDPSTLSLFSPSPRLSLTLNQRAFTQPVLDKNLGQAMQWSGIVISASNEVPKFVEPDKGQGMWEWRGEVDVPEDCVTVEAKGLNVKYFITAQFTSDRIMDHSLSVTVPVFLPSFPRSLTSEEVHGHSDIAQPDIPLDQSSLILLSCAVKPKLQTIRPLTSPLLLPLPLLLVPFIRSPSPYNPPSFPLFRRNKSPLPLLLAFLTLLLLLQPSLLLQLLLLLPCFQEVFTRFELKIDLGRLLRRWEGGVRFLVLLLHPFRSGSLLLPPSIGRRRFPTTKRDEVGGGNDLLIFLVAFGRAFLLVFPPFAELR
ncbi:BZ3500_MvSof-1268-A1-R1_Chr3-1g05787 [Microbotryum saponariae]|uniref:BZ3500_MvSof-1268-A1-R1_Chr3-1g05787 protein n=1 Tax=Microbotryum saponariae TaxID=289078 RepID=A0A2X0NID0_9BASI|nr:BZ3500_MvSof-1268-A1-R1_Chr3-1g05787 [Microbotryum saponariae]SDA04977.1 BZ3501_MvSof-1269-A2-R1_Chr3-1g05457 [Microbotryum saponariae]